MTGFGSKAFTDPDSYRASLGEAGIRLDFSGGADFAARVSWLDMPCLSLRAIEEKAPRQAFVSLPTAPLFVSFPLADGSLVWNGVRLRRGDLVLHAPADRFQQTTTGAARWGLISVATTDLAHYGRTLLGAELSLGVTRLLRPPASRSGDLLRLHVQAGRLAHAKPELLGREVARALEQELVRALVTALGTLG